MTIGDVSCAACATEFGVKLTKSQENQQANVVGRLIESTEASSPARTQDGVGGNLNVTA